MVKIALAISFFLALSLPHKDTGPAKEKIQWLTLMQAQVLSATEPRPILIDLYTNWCYWCKVMDKKTYGDKRVIKYINERFYPVKLNPENAGTIVWDNKNYIYSKENKVNEFALIVTGGKLMYPNTVIFSELKARPVSVPGFLQVQEIEPLLKYFGEGHDKSEGFEEFLTMFKKEW